MVEYGQASREHAVVREPCTFALDRELVRRARREVSELEVVRSIEAALAAAIEYRAWIREVSDGRRHPLT
ncbi:MAG: hypothetical protein ACRELD_08830 [Longimicrobiales bacterium]